MKRFPILFLLLCLITVPACSHLLNQTDTSSGRPPVPTGFPYISRHPKPSTTYRGVPDPRNFEEPGFGGNRVLDLRSQDLSDFDLTRASDLLLNADFDSRTTWPSSEMLPGGFDPEAIMELGKNSGLGVRQLHSRGITGLGVGIAIIDQPLLVEHQEYAGQVRYYEEMDDIPEHWGASMHGAAVASIAVGKSVGVAPEADLYYIAQSFCNSTSYEDHEFACLAKAVYRVLEINRQLPEEQKIRVLSMAIGWHPEAKGYREIMAAVKTAQKEGMLVVCSSIREVHGFSFNGLGRLPTADPDDFYSYTPGIFWAEYFFQGGKMPVSLLIPMDSRTTASFTGASDYAFYPQGAWSWSIPYIAGVYALAVQVKPSITPDEFWSLALKTGQTIPVQNEGKNYQLGIILDPIALIEKLQDQ
jgi:hypothetical protein